MHCRRGFHIGIFDSGVGGLTVMQQMMRALPHEDMVYLGDTLHLPYGGKSPNTIVRYSIENAIFLMEQKIKVLVIACNTASSYALERLQDIFNIPVVGTIKPAAIHAAKVTRNGKIAILGTKATIASGAYQQEIHRFLPEAELFPIACPLFVPLVEEHFIDHAATQLIIDSYLKPLKTSQVDTLLLGCTHYPLLKDTIQKVVGDEVTLVDSAVACAHTVCQLLKENDLISKQQVKPQYRYFVSDDPEKFQTLGKTFLGDAIDSVELIMK